MFEFLIVCSVIWVGLVGLILAYCFFARRSEPDAPVSLSVEELRSNDMADSITYRVSAGAPVSGDVVSRLVTVVVDGVEQTATAYDGQSVDLGNITVPQDSSVVVTLVDVDDAGNKSEPASITFVAADTIPPAQPGFLGVTLVGETTNTGSSVVDVSTDTVVDPSSDENVG